MEVVPAGIEDLDVVGMDLGVESVGEGVPGQVHGHGAAGLPVLYFVLELVEGGRMGIIVVDGLETRYAATFIVGLLGDMQVQLHLNKVPRRAQWSRSGKIPVPSLIRPGGRPG